MFNGSEQSSRGTKRDNLFYLAKSTSLLSVTNRTYSEKNLILMFLPVLPTPFKLFDQVNRKIRPLAKEYGSS
jgi:hypothetical protein